MSGRTYVFAGGGTGGHLFPGIAVAECLTERDPDSRVVFVGTDRPIERDILARTPFEHHPLPAINGRGGRAAFVASRAYFVALRVLRDVRPAAVIGCGGVASFAPIVAARNLRIPVLLLEQNIIPGRATRLLARLNTTVCLTYPESVKFLPKRARITVTGNPVRRDIARLSAEALTTRTFRERKTVLVLGGSQGAGAINDAMLSFVRRHVEKLNGWRIIHQTGRQDEDRIREAYAALGIDATVAAFFDDMVPLYRGSGLVIARAGGTTLSELACAGLPAILVPFPQAKDHHQVANARVFEDAGAAVLIRQTSGDDWQTNLVDCVSRVVDDVSHRKVSAHLMSKLARPGAAEDVVRLLDMSLGSL